MKDFTISRSEGNSICGDDLTIYLQISDGKISKISFAGNTSMITTAAASFWTELALGVDINQVLTLWYKFMVQEWFEVSSKRVRAACIAILATRNAIHQYLDDGLTDGREEVLDN